MSTAHTAHTRWTAQDAAALYRTDAWGGGYITVTPRGTIAVCPDQTPGSAIDLHDVVQGLRERGVSTPVLLRFPGVLDHRMRTLRDVFDRAIGEHGYTGDYRCVYPIKVNQQCSILEETINFGRRLGFGLEVGSKPELLAVLGMTCDEPALPVVCNGFKDREYIETVILATKLGRNITTIVEKFSELRLIAELAKEHGVRPQIGVRVKVSTEGSGRWQSSGGSRSKFGLFASETLEALEFLDREGLRDCLTMLHVHIGSQISNIRPLKEALTELAHVYCELRRLGASGLCTIDVGGGLAVDYDGSQTAHDSSMNYTLAEYASDVVYSIASVCDAAGAPHPTIVTESGRALTAYTSVLVMDVLGVSRFDAMPVPDELDAALVLQGSPPKPLVDLLHARESAETGDLLETLHDAQQARDEAMSLFRLGYLTLPMRALSERLYWAAARTLLTRAGMTENIPDELAALRDQLSDIYFCNFSVFQSAPDSWAIDQLFPVCPIHRLSEQPSRQGVLADITCDSDGTIDRFPTGDEPGRSLPLHDYRPGEPYDLGVFLVGAYQEILGDLHNLLGDTHAAHVVSRDGRWEIDEIIHGDTVREVLSYVQIDDKRLRRGMRRSAERAVRDGRLTVQESRRLLAQFEHGLEGYTYLED